MNLMTAELTEHQFQKVSDLIHKLAGIALKDGKQALVRARLMKRLRALRMDSFEVYFKYLESNQGQHEIDHLVDVLTTNKTSFFRESDHFNFLQNKVLPKLNQRKLRFWTAACSSGEEPFSLAIILREQIPDIDMKDIKILATDISTRMLDAARRAIYSKETLRDMPPQLFQKYFMRDNQSGLYQVKEQVRQMVRIARLNLIDTWPMKGPFNVIFCRNVMIYFDRHTQQNLIQRFWNILETGGFLFVGHSEGLSAITHKFHYVRPAVYQK